jgi:hypothetical protein
VQLVQGLRFIWDSRFFRTLMFFSSSTNLLVNGVFFVVLLRLIRAHYPAAQIGLVSTAAGIGGIIGAIAAPYIIERTRTGWLTVAIAWMCALPLVPLIWWSTPWTACASVFALLLLNPAGNAGIGAYRVAVTPDALQGRVASAIQFTSMSVMPLSPLMSAWLLTWLGGDRAVLVLVVTALVVALALTLSRSVRSVPRPAQWRADLEQGTVRDVAAQSA